MTLASAEMTLLSFFGSMIKNVQANLRAHRLILIPVRSKIGHPHREGMTFNCGLECRNSNLEMRALEQPVVPMWHIG